MVKYRCDPLDLTFAALADPTRRGVLLSLQAGSRGVTELAARSQMSLPGFMKHLRALENAGLLRRRKSGRVVTCTLTAEPMRDAARWLAKYEAFWNERLDALGRYLEKEETQPWKQSARSPRSRSSAGSTSSRPRSGARGRTRGR
ncbi:MAG TPA: metalloregulator ArsR/SmtB family transcription factor [Casimicrobiaceae bacterium]|nr:metalloregulator ArsR/SmtB family transcription factor [Casimicrobiaceae bacterium]